MMSILSRLERLERISPVGGVGILELQLDGSWALTEDGRQLGRFMTEAAGTAAYKGKTLIILDV